MMEVISDSPQVLIACPCCSFRFDPQSASDFGSSKPDKTHFLSQITWDDVAAKLLESSLLLTALELYMELCECGSSQSNFNPQNPRTSFTRASTHELPRLRAFFSNPANFENPSAPSPALTSASKQQQQPARTFSALSGPNATNGKLGVSCFPTQVNIHFKNQLLFEI